MAYRAHVIVRDLATGRPYTAERIEKEFPNLRPGASRKWGYTGTRHGLPGIWVERDRKASFQGAVADMAQYACTTGYAFEFRPTNEPSALAIASDVSFWQGRGARITSRRG